MDRLRVLGPTAGGDAVVLVDDEDGARFVVPVDDLRAVLDASSEPAPPRGVPDHHVRVVPPSDEPAGHGRRLGGLAPGAFKRAAVGAPAARLDGVRALIGESAALARAPEPEPEREAVAPGEPPAPPTEEPRLVRTSTTRLGAGEIQGLLRAGRTVQEVASLAGAPEDWVARLDRTVELERTVLVGQMLRERLARPDGSSALDLGGSIAANLGARGVPEEAIERGWSARREATGPWRVRFAYSQGGLVRQAEWSYDPRTRELQPLDEAAARLGWVPAATA